MVSSKQYAIEDALTRGNQSHPYLTVSINTLLLNDVTLEFNRTHEEKMARLRAEFREYFSIEKFEKA